MTYFTRSVARKNQQRYEMLREEHYRATEVSFGIIFSTLFKGLENERKDAQKLQTIITLYGFLLRELPNMVNHVYYGQRYVDIAEALFNESTMILNDLKSGVYNKYNAQKVDDCRRVIISYRSYILNSLQFTHNMTITLIREAPCESKKKQKLHPAVRANMDMFGDDSDYE